MGTLAPAAAGVLASIVAGILGGYAGGLAAQPTQITAGEISVFFADYYSKATSPADRQLARARLSPGLRALANNTVEEFDRFWSGYAKAVVDEVTPVGPNTFAIGATYTTCSGKMLTRNIVASFVCDRTVALSFLPCPPESVMLDATKVLD